MRLKSDIAMACSSIEEVAQVFQSRSKTLLDEFADLAVAWTDSRARSFQTAHLAPQTETILAGNDALRQQVRSAFAAGESAAAAENNLQLAYGRIAETEAAIANARQLTQSAEELAARAAGYARRIGSDCAALASQISAADMDPGW